MRSLKDLKAEEIEQEVNLQFIEKLVDSNGSIKVLKLRDCSGRLISISGKWDNIVIAAEEKPVTIEKFVVFGTTNNDLVEVSKVFESKEDAEEVIRKEQYRDSSAKLEIKTIFVEKE